MPPDNLKSNRLKSLDDHYELIIIGGGIYGAALCWEASHRGIKTLLVEKNDYASGTSANSLKTIHGGLRSLQSFDLKGVIKGIKERSIFLKIAPNYVVPLPCILPTSKNIKKSKLFINSGIILYNIIQYMVSRVYNLELKIPYASLISLKELKTHLNKVNMETFTGGALWYDAQVSNTERLVLSFIKASQSKGSKTLNHVEVINYSTAKGEYIHSIIVKDKIYDHKKTVNSKVVIDCSLSWDFIGSEVKNENKKDKTEFVKAVNLIVKRKLFDKAAGLNLRHPNTHVSRLFFFSPWKESTMIGTWYHTTHSFPDMQVTIEEAKNYIDEINTAFNEKLLTVNDICNIHVGHLPATELNLNVKSVDDHLVKSYQFLDWGNNGNKHLYSFRGTKYTLARYDAKSVIDNLSKIAFVNTSNSKSHRIPLYNKDMLPDKIKSMPENIWNRLALDYGNDIEKIIEIIKLIPESISLIPATKNYIQAEIYYAIQHEQALTLSDILKRRLNIGSTSPPEIETSQHCADIMKDQLKWSDEEKQSQINDLYASYPDILTH